jgi:serine/threonine-protein kinase
VIESLVGAGGMGEVYRARDSRLDRAVALKVLSPAHADDAQRKVRLEREAKAVAALSHPHICAIHDVGAQDGVEFLVLEYLEGETLADRIVRGALPLEELRRLAIQIADALDRAHRQGIVHRDIKPSNVMLTRSGVKLLDFGIARQVARHAMQAVTEDVALTHEGALVGTIPYMAPEQLAGGAADARTDLFCFGVVLYEAATGRRAFPGAGPAEIMTAILGREPVPLRALCVEASPLFEQAVKRCLAKDPDKRWQSAADMRQILELECELEQSPRDVGLRPRPWSWAALLLSAALVASIAVGLMQRGTPEPPPGAVRFTITPPEGESIITSENSAIAFSADGQRICYVGTRRGVRGLYLRSLASLESTWLAGTEGGRTPFFSPDGQWLGFQAGHKLMKVAVTGGAPRVLGTVAYFSGASWSPKGEIVYVPTFTSGLWKFPADGGSPVRLTEPGPELAHVWPDLLPDGSAVLFTVAGPGPSFDQARIDLLDLATGARRTLVRGGSYARYLAPDRLVFARGGKLLSVEFDPRTRVAGEQATPLVDGVQSDPEGCVAYAVSGRRGLAYVPMGLTPPQRTLVLVDRSGRVQTLSQPRTVYSVRIAPDGHRLATSIVAGLADVGVSVWLHDLGKDGLSRVSFGSDDHSPAWSPDGRRIAFESGRNGPHGIYVRPADGSGEDRLVTAGAQDRYLSDWSPDGRLLAFTEYHPESGADLWFVDPALPQSARPFLKTRFFEDEAAFSPDGQWLAHVSDESGREEVYVRGVNGEGKLAISEGGGQEPVWSRSGSELFFRSGTRLLAVPVRTKPSFAAGTPRVLFDGSYYLNTFPSRSYDVAPDGRFVMLAEVAESSSARQLHVVLGGR